MSKSFKQAALAALACMSVAAPASAGNVLFYHFATGGGGGSYASYGNEIAAMIDAAPGSTVTIRNMNQAIYTDHANFDQIWVYDLNNLDNFGNYVGSDPELSANISSVAAWYNARVAANVGDNLIADGRILSSAFSINETQLIQSFYANLDTAGGGLFLGTDHCPEWCTGINRLNAEINIGAFTGFYGASYAIIDTASILASGVPCSAGTMPNNCLIYSNTTTSFAPSALQANGQFLTPFAYNTTDPNAVLTQAYQLTAISSTFGSRTFGTDPGSQVPEPASMALLGAGLALVAASRRRKR